MAMAPVGEAELAAVRAGAGGAVPRAAIASQGAAQLPEHYLFYVSQARDSQVAQRLPVELPSGLNA